MTRILYDTQTATLLPYPRQDDEDVQGLDPRYLALWIHQEPQPEHDPATHRLEPTEAIDLDALTVTRSWTLVELPPPPPVADWAAFKATALSSSSLNSILANAYQVVPVAASALAPALLHAEQGDCGDFTAAWALIRAAVTVADAVIEGFQQVAEACNLPPEFIAALAPGRERARNADGTFRADDPATPDVNEAWV